MFITFLFTYLISRLEILFLVFCVLQYLKVIILKTFIKYFNVINGLYGVN